MQIKYQSEEKFRVLRDHHSTLISLKGNKSINQSTDSIKPIAYLLVCVAKKKMAVKFSFVRCHCDISSFCDEETSESKQKRPNGIKNKDKPRHTWQNVAAARALASPLVSCNFPLLVQTCPSWRTVPQRTATTMNEWPPNPPHNPPGAHLQNLPWTRLSHSAFFFSL